MASSAPSGSWCLVSELPGSEYRTPGWFHAWREADLFQSGWEGKPEHHEFRDDCQWDAQSGELDLAQLAARGGEHDFRGSAARLRGCDLHDLIEPGEGLELAPALRPVAEQRKERGGEPLRNARVLQQFRHDVFAEHEVGEDHRGHPDQPPRDCRLPACDAVRRHSGYRGE